MGISRIVPRRYPVKQDPKKVIAFLLLYLFLKGLGLPLWFFDESGVDVNEKPRKVLAPCGSKPPAPYVGIHLRETVMGAVNPATGQLETLVMPYANTETFQYFLNYLNTRIGDPCPYLIMDNASWHKTKKLNWGKVIPIYLPPYCPNLNAIEPLWKVLKDRLNVLKPVFTENDLQNRICRQLKHFLNNPEEVKSICQIHDKIN